MTYASEEQSRHKGKPTELYMFEGTYANYYYTSGTKAVRYPNNPEGALFLPIAIKRSEIKAGTQDDDGLDITLQLSVKNEIVRVYGFQAAPPTLNLTIFRFHSIDDVVPYWQGPIENIQVSDGVATIRSPSTLSAALQADVPNVFFQSPCNHVLYDARCKVPEADFSTTAIVQEIDGRALVVDSVGELNGKLIGGEVVLASGERRMITAQLGREIIVNFPFSQLAIGAEIKAAAGCNLAYTGDCAAVFANQINFGGFPFIPLENPFADGIDPSAVPLPDDTCLPINICTPYPTLTSLNRVDPCDNRQPSGWISMPVPLSHTGPKAEYYYQPNPRLFPNGPEGRAIRNQFTIGRDISQPPLELYEVNYYNDPEHEGYQHPDYVRFQGQLLHRMTGGLGGEFAFLVNFEREYGEWELVIQWQTGSCGNVGKPNGGLFDIIQCTNGPVGKSCQCLPAQTLVNQSYAGGFPYTFHWNF